MESIPGAVIEVEGLVKKYPGITAVDDISFTVRQGEIFGLLGPNGAGKSTTIECLEGLRQPEHGRIRILGLDPKKDGFKLRKRIGIQFQSAALPDRLKVWEAIDLFATFYERPFDCHQLLETMQLTKKRDVYLAKLSGGQKQRLFIALALVNQPELVFLDELTTGLDPQARRAMWQLVQEIRTEGKTIFLTTHFMEEAERLCDRVAIIDHGKIIALDTPQNLVNALGTENRVIFATTQPVDVAILQVIPGVLRVEQIRNRVVVYGPKEGLVGRVVNVLETNGIAFNSLQAEQPTLEDVFLSLTGKEIRN